MMTNIVKRIYNACDQPEIINTISTNEYDPNINTISINFLDGTIFDKYLKKLLSRPTEDKISFYHELGHSFCEMYSIDESEEFIEFFGDPDVPYPSNNIIKSLKYEHNDEDFITLYSQMHPLEDFADCFAYLVLNNNIVPKRCTFSKTIKDKIRFIQRCIKEVI